VARAGTGSPSRDEAADAVSEELGALLAAEDDGEREQGVGDLLLAAIALARLEGVDAELALRRAAQRYRARVEAALDQEVMGEARAEG
jgi:NTP pyrophosphatase (non-canonical NTP hydrolase)